MMGYKRSQRKCVLRLSFSTPNLSSFLTPLIVYSTRVCCVLGYGWMRLDFDN